MSDINERAIMIAKMNVKRFNLRDKVKVIKSNGFEKIKDKFDKEGIEIPFPCTNIYMRNKS